MTVQIALATCATLPGLDEDDQLLVGPLKRLGAQGVAAVWDDPSVDWETFDAVVIRNTWDYTSRRDAFVAWAHSVPRLANPADIVEWNTDKRYLADLASAGLPVVPTTWLSEPPIDLPGEGMHVLKPAVGAGSVDAKRFSMHDEHESLLARDHAQRLLDAGHTVMVQPYQHAIDERGETGVIFVGGKFSHAIRKAPILAHDPRYEEGGLYAAERITSREPSAAELDLATAALAAVPGGPERLLYARVDIVSDGAGKPMLMELELTEPSLFMRTTPGSERTFARAIMATLGALRSGNT